MKGLIIKTDRLVLKLLTRVVKYYVARNDYKKHKLDLQLTVEWIRLFGVVVWAALLPGVLYAVAGKALMGVFHVVIWLALACFDWFTVQTTKNVDKPVHDYIFSMRDNPTWYKIHSEILSEAFERSRRMRLLSNGGLMALTLGLFVLYCSLSPDVANNMVWQYLLFNAVVSVLKSYMHFVNDLEPPQEKEKAKESITDLVKRLWGEFVDGFNPQPTFRPV